MNLVGSNQIPNPRTYLPRMQLVADDVKSSKASSWIEYSTYAVDRPYISMNDPKVNRRDFLMIDCDHENFDERPGGFPVPAVVVVTHETGRHHYIYRLKTPVLTGLTARPKPQRVLNAVERAFVWHLNGDEGYANRLTKNPFYDPLKRANDPFVKRRPLHDPLRAGWFTIWNPDAEPLDLRKALIWCEDDSFKSKGKRRNRPDPRLGLGRNMGLFDHTRYWAYDFWRGDRSELFDVAFAYNATLPDPLPVNEVKSTANSICRFMETKYTGKVSRVKKQAPKVEKIQLILHAEDYFVEQCKRWPTNQEISNLTAIPLRTVQRLLKNMADNDISNEIVVDMN